MSFFLVKSILAVLFLAVGIVGVLAMFSLMGKTEHKTSPMALRKLHRSMGFIFVILLVLISVLCVRYVARVGDQISLRAAFHCVFALLLIGVLAVKITIIKWFKGLLNLVPALGIIVFVLAFAVVATSAGYFFVRMGSYAAATGVQPVEEEPAAAAEGDPESGGKIFDENCSSCHATDNDDSGFAPGLKGVLKKDTLPDSGRPATVENIKSQLREPVGMMPSYNSITGQDLADLIEYLKTL
jgi:mono/diheme cytochrome c family protein